MNKEELSHYGMGYGHSQDYTDLAIEGKETSGTEDGVEYSSRTVGVGRWEEVRIVTDSASKILGKPIGSYATLTVGRMDLLSDEDIVDASDLIARELCSVCDRLKIIPDRILAVGLGNKSLTPDTVGTKSADLIKPTLHIREEDEDTFNLLECSEISVLCPGVTAKTGIESLDVIKGVVRRILPSLVIAIDSIATRSSKRLGRTVQISDVGICPGSGIGSARESISALSLGCPVISIGIPTVIDTRALTGERNIESMLVSPREIDEITDAGARIISGAINQAFGIF